MVLLALSMLFLTLMVTMTIGLGLRIRQKHEIQNMADAAAYSNAVMTARTFNNMAVINRLEVSYWVAQAADQSLISWTAYAHAMPAGAYFAASKINATNCPANTWRVVQPKLRAFQSEVARSIGSHLDGPRNAGWQAADTAAGKESMAIQTQIVSLRSELNDRLRVDFYGAVRAQQLTEQIVAASQQHDISVINTGQGTTPNTAATVSMREVDCDFADPGISPYTYEEPHNSGLCLRATWSVNMLHAAMGTRGNPFLTGRTSIPGKVEQRLAQMAANHGVSISYTKNGSAYWSTHQSDGKAPFIGKEAWGDDHGTATVSIGGCTSPPMDIDAYVRSTHLLNHDDEHNWSPLDFENDRMPDVDHTMGDCTPMCPSVWVRTVAFQPSDAESDAWGQPKMVVALERDLQRAPYPWELNFKFPFSATGSASEWDGRGQQLHTRVGNGLSIRRQTALATGIAYYHRREHWDEFPNLLNPFWRATLAPMDVDARVAGRSADVGKSLSAPEYRWQRDAYRTLIGAGFEGLH